MKLIKLTDKNAETWNGTKWEIGVLVKATGEGVKLCTSGVIHCYRSLPLALFMAPIHLVDYDPDRAFEAEGEIVSDDGMKCGAKELTLFREILDFQRPTPEQRIAFGIFCANAVCTDAEFLQWVDNWLSGRDRSAARATATARTTATATAAAEINFIALAEQAMAWVDPMTEEVK